MTGGDLNMVPFSPAAMASIGAETLTVFVGSSPAAPPHVITAIDPGGVRPLQGMGEGLGGAPGATQKTREDEAYGVKWHLKGKP
jgi:hypothetical protein